MPLFKIEGDDASWMRHVEAPCLEDAAILFRAWAITEDGPEPEGRMRDVKIANVALVDDYDVLRKAPAQ